ncbi:MAG: DHH family phosphoesterase, partial [Myxococcales bacterium]
MAVIPWAGMKTLTWRLTDVDETAAAALASHAGIRPLTARILLSRGHGEPEQAARFLTPKLGQLRPPEAMADLDRALDRLTQALRDGQRVGVFGDYDVDGVTTAALLTVALRAFGVTVVPRVASRGGGYGLPPDLVDWFAAQGCRLIVTGDCGTSDFAALARARELGIDVVVIDHHQVPSGERVAHALINPHQPEDRFPFKGLASCGIAFYLMATLRSRLAVTTFDPRELLDLVALGTIADLVPLVAENRILVCAGLRVLGARKRPGIRALMELAQLTEPTIGAEDVSFRLTPRLNAAGRLGDAQLALDLLLAEDDTRASALAAQLDDVNRERQRIQEQVWTEALAAAANWQHAPAIVVGQQGW